MSEGDLARPKVSVCVTTYDHEAFLAQAIESVLSQQVAFPIELVIGEDRSSDRTLEIARGYAERHPETIRLLAHEKNLGPGPNFLACYAASRGEYIAMLDGDDYWTSPQKLATQVALLDRHPEFSMCVHAVREGEGEAGVRRPPGRRRVYRLRDLGRWIDLFPAGTVFRRAAIPEFPDWFGGAPCGDWPAQVLCAQQGDIAYLDEVMACHRIHAGGLWAEKRDDRGAALESAIETGKLLIAHLPPHDHGPFERERIRRTWELAHWHAERGDRDAALACVRECTQSRGFYDPRVALAEPFSIHLRLNFPALWAGLAALRGALARLVGRRR